MRYLRLILIVVFIFLFGADEFVMAGVVFPAKAGVTEDAAFIFVKNAPDQHKVLFATLDFSTVECTRVCVLADRVSNGFSATYLGKAVSYRRIKFFNPIRLFDVVNLDCKYRIEQNLFCKIGTPVADVHASHSHIMSVGAIGEYPRNVQTRTMGGEIVLLSESFLRLDKFSLLISSGPHPFHDSSVMPVQASQTNGDTERQPRNYPAWLWGLAGFGVPMSVFVFLNHFWPNGTFRRRGGS